MVRCRGTCVLLSSLAGLRSVGCAFPITAALPTRDIEVVRVFTLALCVDSHATLSVPPILNNRTLTLVRDADLTRAIPEFVLDHEGVKRFNWASRNRRVGS